MFYCGVRAGLLFYRELYKLLKSHVEVLEFVIKKAHPEFSLAFDVMQMVGFR